MQIILLLLLGQQLAQADEPKGAQLPSTYLIDSNCTKESKECMILFEQKDLPEGESCGKPTEKTKWTVPQSIPKEFLKAATALLDRANAGDLSNMCVNTKALTTTPGHKWAR